MDGKALCSVGGFGNKPAPTFTNEAFVNTTGDGEREGEGTAADLKLRSSRGETNGFSSVARTEVAGLFGVTTTPGTDMRLPVLDEVENAGRVGTARDLDFGEGPAARIVFKRNRSNCCKL